MRVESSVQIIQLIQEGKHPQYKVSQTGPSGPIIEAPGSGGTVDLTPYTSCETLTGETPAVDVSARDIYTLTTSGNTTFSFTQVPVAGTVGSITLIITAGGVHTLTWPSEVRWGGGVAPDAPAAGETDVFTFTTVDGGLTWFGFQAGDAMA